MDAQRYRQIKELFSSAHDLPPAEQREFLERECSDDPELRAEVEELLEHDRDGERDDAFERAMTGDGGSAVRKTSPLPERIAGYRILRVCGHGGMGTVYEAEQDSPKRRVALKVIQSGLLREGVRQRFQREAEILGRLQHPGIAQVIEAGEFDLQGTPLPFFAMEFVEGLPLLSYARDRGLDVDERLELFLRICDAVHYAHGQGVVHRDLKPDNILVVEATGLGTNAGQPKVLDFGVAHLSDSDVHATLSTSAGELLGSVPYMSPEQASARPGEIDARSDVYSLGVVLYQILSGEMPYAVSDRPLAEALITIQERDPKRLSAADGSFRGDLETIVGKCLEKDRDWRYGSVGLLAADLRRYVSKEPIHARPPSTWYQLERFARRNRVLVGGAAATLLALAIGLVFALIYAKRATENEERAVAEAYRSSLTATDALRESDPLAARRALYGIPEEKRGWEWRYLESRLSRDLLTFGSYFGRSSLVLVDDGRHVLAGSDSEHATLWDPATGASLQTWIAPEPVTVWGIAPDGSRIAAGTSEGAIFVIEREASEWERWGSFEGPIHELVFAPGAGRLAVLQDEAVHVGARDEWRSAPLRRRWSMPSVAFSPDGSRLVVLVRARAVPTIMMLFNAELEELARKIHHESPNSVQFTPDGKRLVCASDQRNVEFYDAASLSRLDSWLGHAGETTDVELAEYGVLSVSKDDTVRVWDSAGTCTEVLAAPNTERAVFLSESRIITAGAEGLRLWNLGGPGHRVLRGHTSYVYDVAFSGDGTLLASHGPFGDKEVLIHDLVTGRVISRHPGLVYREQNAFSSDGFFAFASDSRRIVVPWYGGEELYTFQTTPLAHVWTRSRETIGTRSAEVSWVDTGAAIFRTEYDLSGSGGLRMFAGGEPLVAAPAKGYPKPTLGEHPRLFVGNLADNQGVFAGSISDLIIFGGVLDDAEAASVESYLEARRAGGADGAGELPPVKSAELLAHFRADAQSVRLTPGTGEHEGARLVQAWSAHNDRSLELRATGYPEYAITFEADGEGPDRVVIMNTLERFRWFEIGFERALGHNAITVFWLGHYLTEWQAGYLSTAYAIGTESSMIRTWPKRDPRVSRLGVADGTSADGTLGASAFRGHPFPVRLRDLETGALKGELDGRYIGLDFHPTRSWIACSDDKGRVDIWDTRTLERQHGFQAHRGAAYCVTWSPDGARLVTGGNDNVARVWDGESFALLLELRGHDQYVKAAAFSSDGSMLATASGDATVRIWDSVAPGERYQEALAAARLEDEVRPDVAHWLASLAKEEVADRVRARWAEDEERLRAALIVLAALTAD